jgi:hypothetical protein
LRLPDFETVGISVRVWVDPRAIVRRKDDVIFHVPPCVKKKFRISIFTCGGAYGRLAGRIETSLQISDRRKAPPPPFPKHFFFLYKISDISLCIYHLSQTIFNKIKNSKFNWNILQRRRTLK